MTIARSSITGRFISKLAAMLSPDTTQIEKSPRVTKEEWRYIYSALDAQTGSSRNVALRTKLLAKIDRMLG